MTACVTKKADHKELERMLVEASYSGERFILQREDGVSVGIVPVEDVKILEELESSIQLHW